MRSPSHADELRHFTSTLSLRLKTSVYMWFVFIRMPCYWAKFQYVCAQIFYCGNFAGNQIFIVQIIAA